MEVGELRGYEVAESELIGTGVQNQMITSMKTTDLPMAAQLLKSGCNMGAPEKIEIRGKRVLQFVFPKVESTLLDNYRTGADGIAQYETCRKFLMRMINLEMR